MQCCDFGLVQPWTTWSKVGPMPPSVVQGRPFCGGLDWSKVIFGRAGPGPRWDLAWRSANLEKFRLRRSFARGPAPSTPVLEESLDFEARRGKKEGFFYPHFIWSYVVQCWSYVASPTPSQMVQCASKCEIAALHNFRLKKCAQLGRAMCPRAGDARPNWVLFLCPCGCHGTIVAV